MTDANLKKLEKIHADVGDKDWFLVLDALGTDHDLKEIYSDAKAQEILRAFDDLEFFKEHGHARRVMAYSEDIFPPMTGRIPQLESGRVE